MGKQTGIEWCAASWNPWTGCRRVSTGCTQCYMYREKTAFGQDPTRVVRSKTTFRDPLKWTAPTSIFACSWSDWFIEEADAWRHEAWEIIRATPQHLYLILTKRPELITPRLPWRTDETPWPHVWLGVSVEHARLLWRVKELMKAPAAHRFLSLEPLLGPIDLSGTLPGPARHGCSCLTPHGCGSLPADGGGRVGEFCHECPHGRPARLETPGCGDPGPFLEWVICGGESGKDARPTHPDWIASVITQCQAAGAPCFVKQLGSWRPALWGARATGDRPWGTLNTAGEWFDRTTPWNGRQGSDSKTGELAMVNLWGDDIARGNHGGRPLDWPAAFRVRKLPPELDALTASPRVEITPA